MRCAKRVHQTKPLRISEMKRRPANALWRDQAVCSSDSRYARTRKVFEAYRQAGYSKKFAAEHREELEAYRGAKKAFQKMEQAKTPSGWELQVAFEQALAEKRDAYAAYWSKQQEWREMMVVKGNVEQVLKAHEQQDKTKAKETLR